MAADEALSEWLATHLGIEDAWVAEELGGGNSNVTLLVEAREGRYVIRRPPANTISPLAARGVRREYHTLAALQAVGDGFRVPRAMGFCDDPAVIGAPFAVVGHVSGVAITDTLPAQWPPGPDTLAQVGEQLVDSLAAIHALDWRQLDLPDFSPPRGFLERQLDRWLGIRAEDRVRDLPLLERVAEALRAGLPSRPAEALVHGDYHLDNTLFLRDRPELTAIIDWELASFGDPRLDLGLVLAFWGERPLARPGFDFVQAVTRRADVPTRQALAERWSRASGHPLEDPGYWCAFALWRLAAMVEGAYCLHRRGRVDSDYARNLEFDVPALLEEAASELGLDVRGERR